MEYVTVLNYTVTELYATSLYTSCKDVKSPATNAPALDVMCGSSDCSPHVSENQISFDLCISMTELLRYLGLFLVLFLTR